MRFLPMVLLMVAMSSQWGLAEGPPALSAQRKKQLVSAYDALRARGEIEKHKIAALPEDVKTVSIDVSDKIRSASFGHKTWVVVAVPETSPPTDPNTVSTFYVQYGRSTNTPPALFGPFHLPGQD